MFDIRTLTKEIHDKTILQGVVSTETVPAPYIGVSVSLDIDVNGTDADPSVFEGIRNHIFSTFVDAFPDIEGVEIEFSSRTDSSENTKDGVFTSHKSGNIWVSASTHERSGSKNKKIIEELKANLETAQKDNENLSKLINGLSQTDVNLKALNNE